MTKNSMNRYIGNILFESIHKDHGFWYQVTDVDVDQDSGECFFKAKQIWEDKNNDTSQRFWYINNFSDKLHDIHFFTDKDYNNKRKFEIKYNDINEIQYLDDEQAKKYCAAMLNYNNY